MRCISSNINIEFFYEYLECRKTIATLYPEIWAVPTGYPFPETLEWSSRVLAEPAALTHVYGRPGSGKSVLSAHLRKLARSSAMTTLSFHFSKSDNRRSTCTDLLLSFLRQLLFQKQSVFQSAYVRTLYNSILQRACWTAVELWGLLRAMLASLNTTSFVCIIDALDECDDTSMWLLSNIVKLQVQIETKCKFIITSQPVGEFLALLEAFPAINLDSETDMKADKEHLIRRRMQKPHLNDAVKNLRGLEATMLELNLALDMQEEPCLATMTWLGTEQQDYSQLYEQLLLDIPPPDRDWSRKALSWLMFSAWPLTINQLAVAVTVVSSCDTHSARQIDKYIHSDMTGYVQHTLGKLVVVVHDEVHFTHRSVRDFLVRRTDKQNLNFDQDDVWHSRLAATCLRFLCFDDLQDEFWMSYISTPPQLRLQHPIQPCHEFLAYATIHWATHLRQSNCEKPLKEQVLGFLQNSTVIRWWSQVYWSLKSPLCAASVTTPNDSPDSTLAPMVPRWDSSLEVAAHLGLPSIVEALLSDGPYPTEDIRNALGLAAEEGHAATVQLLLQGIDMELKLGPLAMKKACERGHSSVVELVLRLQQHDIVDLDACLFIAAERGHDNISRLLISAGANVNATTQDRDTPLILAARQGFEETVLQLLKEGADVHTKNKEFTALHEAANNGHLTVVQELLRVSTCDIDSSASSITPLHLAAQNGHHTIVKELINQGANTEACSGAQGFTPLHYAAWKGHSRVLEILLGAGVKSSQVDTEGLAPLALACIEGHLEAVNALLFGKVDAEVQAHSRNNKRPLHFAAEGGHHHVLRALLESGVTEDPTTIPEKETPLHLALFKDERSYLEVLKVLLEYEADVNKPRSDGCTTLHLAAKYGCVDAVRSLLEAGADPAATNRKGHSVLYFAVSAGQTDVAKLLLDEGVDANFSKNGDAMRVLFKAAEEARTELLQLLVDRGADIEVRDNSGWTALQFAARYSTEPTVRLLVDSGASINAKTNEDLIPLHLACCNLKGGVASVRLLLDRGTDIKARTNLDWTPLHFAAQYSTESTVKLLLDHGASIEAKTNEGSIPLHLACYNLEGGVASARLLLDRGTDIGARDNDGYMVLHYAAQYSTEIMVQMLLDRGASIEAKTNEGSIPLHLACLNLEGGVASARLLLDRGTDIEVRDNNGCTLLHYAAQHSTETMVQMLLDRGASIEAKTNTGLIPLHLACLNLEGGVASARLLLDCGTDIEARDKNGCTVLHYAAQHSTETMVQMLLDRGADLEAKDLENLTALYLASREGNEATVKLLLEHGADMGNRVDGARTLLYVAAWGGQQAIVNMVLDLNVDLERPGGYYGTPLQAATLGGHKDTVKRLLSVRADVFSKDAHGWTPLLCASLSSDNGIQELFLDYLNTMPAPKATDSPEQWSNLHKHPFIRLEDGNMDAICGESTCIPNTRSVLI